jgi:hypothetical protein
MSGAKANTAMSATAGRGALTISGDLASVLDDLSMCSKFQAYLRHAFCSELYAFHVAATAFHARYSQTTPAEHSVCACVLVVM